MLTRHFFNRDAAKVGKDLLGKVLRVRYHQFLLAAQIIETEAYYRREKASHSSLGYTEKRKALFMPPGTIYMYYAHGGDSLNISCRGPGNAVLIKSAIPYIDEKSPQTNLDIMMSLNPGRTKMREHPKLCSGQTLLCKSLGLKVTKWDQQTFVPDQFYFEEVGYHPEKIIVTTRLGIPQGRDEHLPLRFVDYHFARYATSNPLTKKRAAIIEILSNL